MSRLALIAAAVLALAACTQESNRPSNADGPANAASPAVGGAAPGVRLGATIPVSQLPQLRTGLWEETETGEGGQPTVNTTCERGGPQDMDMDGCTDVVARRTLTGGFVLTATCASDGSRMRMRMHAEGDFTSRYTLESELVMTTGEQTVTHRSRTSGRYVGPCPAGRRPGE